MENILSKEYALEQLAKKYILEQKEKEKKFKNDMINHFLKRGDISQEEYEKYLLSEDPNYLPKLKNNL